jgi:hypothetical protein
MSRRAVVLILAGVIAAAVAIPAVANPSTTAVTASVKGLSKRALAKAKDSLRIARKANRAARRATKAATDATVAARAAQGTASAAGSTAAGALRAATSAGEKAAGAEQSAAQAKAEAASTRAQVGLASGSVETASVDFVKLGGGPVVTVDVPASGLVQVWGQALLENEGSDDAAVSLYVDGQPAAGQAECGPVAKVLFSGTSLAPGEPILFGTPATLNAFGTCGTLGAPGPVLIRAAASGEHSFELRYAACTCSGGTPEVAIFSQRRLVVAPLP